MQVNNIKKLLGIKEKRLTNFRIIEKKCHLIVYCDMKRRKFITCKSCGSEAIRLKDYRVRTIKHTSCNLKTVILKVRYQRMKCTCGKTIPEKLYFVQKGYRITNNLYQAIIHDLKSKISIKDLAKRYRVSSQTIIRVIRNFSNKYKGNFLCKELPEVLSFDEFSSHTSKEKYAFVFGDPVNGKVLDILPNRRKETLIKYFMRFPYEERSKVKYVCTDMWDTYRDITNKLFPNAVLIVDRFHFVRNVFWAFNKVRVEVMKSFDVKSYEYYIFKNHWRTLTKTYDELSHRSFYSNKLRHYTTNQQIVDYALNSSELFYKAYTLKEKIFTLKYTTMNKSEITEYLEEWCTEAKLIGHEQFNNVVLTIKNWNDGIVNSYVNLKYNNGFIEGINNVIKVFKKIAFGHKSFNLFRNRLLLYFN